MVSTIEFADNEELKSYLTSLTQKMMSVQGEANRLNIFKDILNILLVNKMFLKNYSSFRVIFHKKILEFLQDDFAKQDNNYVNLSNIMLRVIEEINNEQEDDFLNNNNDADNDQEINNREYNHDYYHEYDIINEELLMIKQEREDEDNDLRHIDEFN